MQFYNKLSGVHDLLKSYGCKATYANLGEEEYREDPDIAISMEPYADTWFYRPLSSIEDNGKIEPEYSEIIVSSLDVVVKTKIKGAECGEIRFDITYSEKAHKYSMYVSLPTHSKSVSLSKDVYNTQDKVLAEVQKWLITAKCKKEKTQQVKTERKSDCEQISLF